MELITIKMVTGINGLSKVIEIAVHLTIQFVDGKIIEEWGFWDTSTLNEELKLLGQTAYISN